MIALTVNPLPFPITIGFQPNSNTNLESRSPLELEGGGDGNISGISHFEGKTNASKSLKLFNAKFLFPLIQYLKDLSFLLLIQNPQMISNPNLVFHSCIAKGPIILAEFSTTKEPGIELIAQICIKETPPHHSLFSHTIRKKTYTFLIDDPYAYFAIFDENMEKSESLCFLNRVKTGFEEFLESNIIKDHEIVGSFCFQRELDSMFREILALDMDLMNSLNDESSKNSRNSSWDSAKGRRAMIRPLLAKPSKLLTKKKRLIRKAKGDNHVKGDGGFDNNMKFNDVGENRSREISVSMMPKSGVGFYMRDDEQKAKQIWKKHVSVILILDLIVCALLLGGWLWVCNGFKCING